VVLLASYELAGPRSNPGAGLGLGESPLAAYVIYQGEVLDAERYEEHKAQVSPNIAAAGGRYLVRGGAAEALEGDLPAGRTVVLEFPTRRAVLDLVLERGLRRNSQAPRGRRSSGSLRCGRSRLSSLTMEESAQ
jgi:uncharacterized protein (DUF1330 family)